MQNLMQYLSLRATFELRPIIYFLVCGRYLKSLLAKTVQNFYADEITSAAMPAVRISVGKLV